MKVVAGIDVGKTRLDVSVSVGPVQGFDNTPTGLTALVGWLERHGVTDVVCEATGGYERALVRRVRHQAWSVHVAHPNRVRHFARAAGYQAKTDALDAQMLSRYGQAFELPNTVAQDADSEVLQDLLRRRKPLVDQRVQEHHRRDKGLTHGAHTSTQRHIQGLDKEIGRLDEEYRQALDQSVELSALAALYQSVPGVGELTAATLVGFLPELGHYSGKQLTALVGAGAVGPRQWPKAGVSRHPRRPGHRAPGVILGGLGGDTLQPRPTAVLSAPVPQRQDRQGGLGRGHAQAAAAAQRHCPATNPLGGTPSPSRLKKGLTNNTDTPAQAGIQGAGPRHKGRYSAFSDSF